MRVLVAGATGAIGRPLVAQLVEHGHTVHGMTRSESRAAALREAGAEPLVCDALDAAAVLRAVERAQPDVIVHQLTAIPQRLNPKRFARDFELTDKLRTVGTRSLLAAGVPLIAQSIAFNYSPGPVGRVHEEDDSLWPVEEAPPSFRSTCAALHELEGLVAAAGGTLLRYGRFYGPGTAIAADSAYVSDVKRRRLPIVGDGGGVWSFIHTVDAATATRLALEAGTTGIYNIVDDEPARVSDWLPGLAVAVGAPRPLRIPAWLARPLVGDLAVATMTVAQGASNARAKRELAWQPAYRSWREGFQVLS